MKLGAREKTAARKIFQLKMALDAQPVFCTLHQENRMLDGFKFEDGQATGARRGQNVQDPVFTNGPGKDLRVGKMWIERPIHADDILAYKKLQPALGSEGPRARRPRTLASTLPVRWTVALIYYR